MTAGEVERLITEREGRLCIRMFRRADGTVITKDCPVGLRAVRKRVATMAGAALAAVLGLFSVSFGQKLKTVPNGPMIQRSQTSNNFNQISGTIGDMNGTVISGASISITSQSGTKSVKTKKDGTFSVFLVPTGEYSVKVKVTSPYFRPYQLDLKLDQGERVNLNMLLAVGDMVGVVTIGDESLIDMQSTSVTTKITTQQMSRLPY
jgi:hypothetical protein